MIYLETLITLAVNYILFYCIFINWFFLSIDESTSTRSETEISEGRGW
jgi:hypothetical protein